MGDIIVAEDTLGSAIAAHAFDHGGMVQRVGIDDQPGKELGQGRERGVIGDIGRGEQQRRFLAMQIGQFGLELLVIDRRARDVARPARACAGGAQRFFHGFDHHGVLPHAQIVVAAPNGDILLRPVGFGPDGMGELTIATLDVDEGPVASFVMQARNRRVELLVIVHARLHLLARTGGGPSIFSF